MTEHASQPTSRIHLPTNQSTNQQASERKSSDLRIEPSPPPPPHRIFNHFRGGGAKLAPEKEHVTHGYEHEHEHEAFNGYNSDLRNESECLRSISISISSISIIVIIVLLFVWLFVFFSFFSPFFFSLSFFFSIIMRYQIQKANVIAWGEKRMCTEYICVYLYVN